jgi:hypothetical protein
MAIFGEQAAEQPPRAFGYRLLDYAESFDPNRRILGQCSRRAFGLAKATLGAYIAPSTFGQTIGPFRLSHYAGARSDTSPNID